MKAFRLFAWILLGLFLVAVLAVGSLHLPWVQKRIVYWAVDTRPDETFEVDRVKIGWKRTTIDRLRFSQPGGAYAFEKLRADVSLYEVFFRRRAVVGDLEITGVFIDASEPEEAPERDQPFLGLLNPLKLPVPAVIDRFHGEGVVLFPGTEHRPSELRFHLTGRDAEPGGRAEVEAEGVFEDRSPEAYAERLQVRATGTVGQSGKGEIDLIVAEGLVTLAGGSFGPEETVELELDLQKEVEGEFYGFRILPPGPATGAPALLTAELRFREHPRRLSGWWEAGLPWRYLERFLHEERIPEFDLRGAGTVDYALTRGEAEVDGEIMLDAGDLGPLADDLPRFSGSSLVARLALILSKEAIRADSIHLVIDDVDRQTILNAATVRPFTYRIAERDLQHKAPGEELLNVQLQSLPAELIPFLAGGTPEGFDIGGGAITGEISAFGEETGAVLVTTELLQVADLWLRGDEGILVSGLDGEGVATARIAEEGLEVIVDDLRLNLPEGEAVAASGVYSAPTGTFEVRLRANLPAVLAQPALQKYANLETGLLRAEVRGRLETPGTFELQGELTDMLYDDGPDDERPPDLSFAALLRQEDDEVWSLDVPLEMQGGGGVTDLRLNGNFTLSPDPGERFHLILTSQGIAEGDIRNLLNAFENPEVDEPPARAEDERDDAPFWFQTAGRLDWEIGLLKLDGGYLLHRVEGSLVLAREAVEGEVRGNLAEGPLKGQGEIRFDPDREMPYVMDARLEAPRLDVGALFEGMQEAAGEGRPPMVEGIFSIGADIEGEGFNAPHLLTRLSGRASLQSDGGQLRLFYTENPLVLLGMAAAGALGAVGGEFMTIIQIANALSEVPYHTMEARLDRDDDLNFHLRHFEMIGPELRLLGRGEIAHRHDTPVADQPVVLRLALGARGDLEEMLGSAYLLGEDRDELGFRTMAETFAIEGTLADPDIRPFYRTVVNLVLGLAVPGPAEDEAPPLPDRGRPESR